MKKFILTSILLLVCGMAQAKTLYVGPGGHGDCSGLKDVPYSQDQKDCRLDHPFRALPPTGNNPVKLSDGDVLIIEGNHMMGLNAIPNLDTAACYPNWAYSCFMRPIPSNVKILGKGWDQGCPNPPKLWATERAGIILNLNGSNNVEIQCLEVTDNSECFELGPNKCQRDVPPFGQWGSTGMSASNSANVLLRNVNIHGMALRGVHAGRLKDWRIEKSKINNNSFVGWDGDIGAGQSSNSGQMNFTETEIKYNGCGEKNGQPFNCFSQDQGGYGDGLGTHQTSGDWNFTDCDISYNVSDGVDLLYHDGSGTITIKGGRYENNAGNQLKTNARNVVLDHPIITAKCDWYRDHTEFLWQPATFNHCRAGGQAFAVGLPSGAKINILGAKFNKVGYLAINSSGGACNGSEVISVDNATTFELVGDGKKYYASGIGGNGDGPCGKIALSGGGVIQPPSPTPIPVPPPQIPNDIIPPVITNVDAKTDLKTAIVLWDLNELGTGQVEYGLTTTYGILSVLESSFDYSRHSQNLSGLTPNTTYNYRVKSKDQAGNLSTSGNFTFKTLPLNCVTDNSCANLTAPCGETKTCTDNCGTVFTKVGVVCPCIPNLCDATCGQPGKDNCGGVCQGPACPESEECTVEIKRAKCADVKVEAIP